MTLKNGMNELIYLYLNAAWYGCKMYNHSKLFFAKQKSIEFVFLLLLLKWSGPGLNKVAWLYFLSVFFFFFLI